MKKGKTINSSGITLIALVVTIIVLLILAGISIVMLAGDNNILSRTKDARIRNGIGQEKEVLSLAWNSCIINKTTQNDEITDTNLKNAIKNNGYDNVSVNKSGNKFKVTFESGNIYTIKYDGTIQKYEKVEPTAIYAKLYTDGTLILSSTDYTDETRTIANNGDYGDVSEKTNYYPVNNYKLEGDFPGWIDENISYPANGKINKVIIKDKIVPTNTSHWFTGCSNLTSIEGLQNMDTSNVTNMERMFYFCSSLTNLDLRNFDTSKVTNMSTMFAYSTFTTLNLSSFDTSEVANMSNMFWQDTELQNIDISSFDTSKVTSMKSMFSGCIKLSEIDVSHFETKEVTDMGSMFYGCGGLGILDLSNFDTSKVTSMSGMFENCNTVIDGVRYGEFVAKVIIGSKWNPAMTESATGYNGIFEIKN